MRYLSKGLDKMVKHVDEHYAEIKEMLIETSMLLSQRT
jgi:hypothetical protein